MNCQRIERNELDSAPSPLTVVSAPKRSRVRRKARKNRALAAVELISMFAAILCVLWVAGLSVVDYVRETITPKQAPSIAKVSVASGDTLWSIARKLGSVDDQRADTINKIVALNPQLHENSNLVTGEVILVPVTRTAEQDGLYLADVPKSGGSRLD